MILTIVITATITTYEAFTVTGTGVVRFNGLVKNVNNFNLYADSIVHLGIDARIEPSQLLRRPVGRDHAPVKRRTPWPQSVLPAVFR